MSLKNMIESIRFNARNRRSTIFEKFKGDQKLPDDKKSFVPKKISEEEKVFWRTRASRADSIWPAIFRIVLILILLTGLVWIITSGVIDKFGKAVN